MPLHTEITNNLLIRGSSDILQYSEIRQAVAAHLPSGLSNESVVEIVINHVLYLVDADLAEVGPLKKSTVPLEVVPLRLPREVLGELLWSSFVALGNPPDLGGVIWVQLTQAGQAAASKIEQS